MPNVSCPCVAFPFALIRVIRGNLPSLAAWTCLSWLGAAPLLGSDESDLEIAPRGAVSYNARPTLGAASREARGEDLTISLSSKEKTQRETREAGAAGDLLRRSTTGDESAQRTWQALPERTRTWALARALESGQEALRRRALEELSREEHGTREAALAQTARLALAKAAVQESNAALRAQAQQAWLVHAKSGGREAAEEMAQGLDVENPLVQKRAFEALKAAGGNGVLEVLITKITRRWGKFARGHILIAQQRSYVADYDVSGAVYDPVVRSFLTGVVLDTQILEVQVTQYIVEELRRLGANHEVIRQPKEWENFVQKKRAADGR